MLQGLACGARIIAYDGSPFYPNVHHFLNFLSAEGCVVHVHISVYASEMTILRKGYNIRYERAFP